MDGDDGAEEEPFVIGGFRRTGSNDGGFRSRANGGLIIGLVGAKLILEGGPENRGGHRWNSNRPGKSLFPNWSDMETIEAVQWAIDEPQLVVRQGGTTYRRREVSEVIIEVSSFEVLGIEALSHAFPVNGRGVRYNPNPIDPKDDHLTGPISLPLDRIELERYSRKHDR